jgi:DNA invertase Pin-like site-specific DNA recombinase
MKHQKGGIERQNNNMPKNIDKTFTDEASGKDTERAEFQKMMDYVREGDTVYFESFSRISRSLPDLLNILDTFSKKGVAFVSLKENISTEGATGRLVVSVLGAISAYEREINAERREYGFRKALEAGKVGRPSAERTEEYLDAYKEWKAKKITAKEAMKRAGVSSATWYKMAKEEEKEG